MRDTARKRLVSLKGKGREKFLEPGRRRLTRYGYLRKSLWSRSVQVQSDPKRNEIEDYTRCHHSPPSFPAPVRVFHWLEPAGNQSLEETLDVVQKVIV